MYSAGGMGKEHLSFRSGSSFSCLCKITDLDLHIASSSPSDESAGHIRTVIVGKLVSFPLTCGLIRKTDLLPLYFLRHSWFIGSVIRGGSQCLFLAVPFRRYMWLENHSHLFWSQTSGIPILQTGKNCWNWAG